MLSANKPRENGHHNGDDDKMLSANRENGHQNGDDDKMLSTNQREWSSKR